MREYERALKIMRSKKPDPVQALILLEEAHARGDARASYAIGTWYLHGAHLKKNVVKAMKLIRIGADAGVEDAMWDLAVSYEKGIGVRKNDAQALRLYVRLALVGHGEALDEVGRCYFYGIGCKADRAIARVWLAAGMRFKKQRESRRQSMRGA